MKKRFQLLVLFNVLCLACFGQDEKAKRGTDIYTTSGFEMIFSGANIMDHDHNKSGNFRFAPVINVGSLVHFDFTEHIGLITGWAIRNVGYIYNSYKDPVTGLEYEKRFRSYNLGIPFGIKLGNVRRMFVYGGYEFELPFLYKEKKYEGGDRTDKITGWFSSRQQSYYNSGFIGLQFPYGVNVKFKYYWTEFHNQNYTDNAGVKPYQGIKTNIFYVSLDYFLFRNKGLNRE